MTNKDFLSVGLVGTRAFEAQAWRSAGAQALEDAYWASSAPRQVAPKHSRLMQFVERLSATLVIAATPK